MLTTDVRPTSVAGIKRLAKVVSKQENITHTQALNLVAVRAGFSNYQHALRGLSSSTTQASPRMPSIYISAFWYDRKTKQGGREIIELSLSKPLDEIVQPRQYKAARGLWNFARLASDHLSCQVRFDSADSALSQACAAGRTLQFMAATGLRPSSARKSTPSGTGDTRIPGQDHSSVWFDPKNKKYIALDELYTAAVRARVSERAAWAEHYDWEVIKSIWPGMYYPDGGSELYLMSDRKKGLPLAPISAALETLPAPITSENCERIIEREGATFTSPGELAVAEVKASRVTPLPRNPRAPNNAVGYEMFLTGPRQRPKAKMSVEMHSNVGTLLKQVLSATEERAGVYKRVDSVRCELDNWVQVEHDHKSLSNEVFFDLYYHENSDSPAEEQGWQGRQTHIDRLQKSKNILLSQYPDCKPLRELTGKLDGAIKSLQEWAH